MDFELQVKMFTEQLEGLIDEAKAEAGRAFNNERAGWEQKERDLKAEIAEIHHASVRNLDRAEAAEDALKALQAKISALV